MLQQQGAVFIHSDHKPLVNLIRPGDGYRMAQAGQMPAPLPVKQPTLAKLLIALLHIFQKSLQKGQPIGAGIPVAGVWDEVA